LRYFSKKLLKIRVLKIRRSLASGVNNLCLKSIKLDLIFRFSSDDIVSKNFIKSSAIRNIKSDINSFYKDNDCEIKELLELIKEPNLIKWYDFNYFFSKEKINIICSNGIIFFQIDGGKFYPHLKILHMFPNILPKVQIDKGAIKYILQGADIMAPGILSGGGFLPSNLKCGDLVVFLI
jgi:malignant T-cell-amplified sequence